MNILGRTSSGSIYLLHRMKEPLRRAADYAGSFYFAFRAFFLRSAHRRFISSESLRRPAAVMPPVRLVLAFAVAVFEERLCVPEPSSASIACIKRSRSCLSTPTISSLFTTHPFPRTASLLAKSITRLEPGKTLSAGERGNLFCCSVASRSPRVLFECSSRFASGEAASALPALRRISSPAL